VEEFLGDGAHQTMILPSTNSHYISMPLCLVFPHKPRLHSKILNGGMIVPSPFMWHIVLCRWGMYSQCAEKGTGFLHYFSVQILRLLIWSTVDKAKRYLCSKSFLYEPTQVPMKMMMVMLCRHSYWLIIDSQVNAACILNHPADSAVASYLQ
jgi:hypothetical protein